MLTLSAATISEVKWDGYLLYTLANTMFTLPQRYGDLCPALCKLMTCIRCCSKRAGQGRLLQECKYRSAPVYQMSLIPSRLSIRGGE